MIVWIKNKDEVNYLGIAKEPTCDGNRNVVITTMVYEHPKGFGPRQVYSARSCKTHCSGIYVAQSTIVVRL